MINHPNRSKSTRTRYTVTLGADETVLGEFLATSPLNAARNAHRSLQADNKEPPGGYDYVEHGPDWGRSAERSSGSGHGGESFDDCMRVYSAPDVRAAVVQMRKRER